MFNKINRLAIKLYSGCNMNCSYCFQSFNDKYLPKEFNDFENLYKFLVNLSYENNVIVTFCGGEMTLRPDLIKKCQKEVFKKIERIKDVKFIYAIISNGTNIDVLLSLFDNNVLNPSYCNLSWDGLYSVSKSRHCSQYNDEYLKKSIIKVGKSDYNEQLSIVHALTPTTIKYLNDSFRFCIDNDVLSFGYYPIHEAFYDDEFHKIFKEQLNLIYQSVINALEHHKNINFFNLEMMRIKQDKLFFTCKKLGYNYYINPLGDVYPCIYFGDNGLYKLGTIKDGVNENAQKRFINDYLHYPQCDYKQCKCVCCGECPAACAVHNGNMNIKFKNLCKIREIEIEIYVKYQEQLNKLLKNNNIYTTEDIIINDDTLKFDECDLKAIISQNRQPHYQYLRNWHC